MDNFANLVCRSTKSGKRYAFFDVDETLISLKSMFDFFPFWCNRQKTPELRKRFDKAFAEARSEGQSREQLNRLYYRFFQLVPMRTLKDAGREWFEDRFCGRRPPYVERVVAQLKAHQRLGDTPVFVSGSMLPLLEPLATALQVEHCLCTKLTVDVQGRLTGDIESPQTIGRGKSDAIMTFLQQNNGVAQDCYAYGDDVSDLPMLEAVGNAVAVGDVSELTILAVSRGWSHLHA
ncbi:HAD-IB family hydrolase [Pseudomonas sp. MOB-449]|nr:HAD-IB family hydrolase [Pseudomonas sp. MOB-449]